MIFERQLRAFFGLGRGSSGIPLSRGGAATTTRSGSVISTEDLLKIYPVAATIRIISEAIAQLDIPDNELLNNPNPYNTKTEFIRQLVIQYLVYGNVFVFKKEGLTTTLTLLPPSQMTVEVDPSGNPIYIFDKGSTNSKVYPAEDILHLKDVVLDNPFESTSKFMNNADLLGTFQSISRSVDVKARQSVVASGVLSCDDMLEKSVQDNLAESLDTFLSGSSNEGGTLILHSGVKFEQVQVGAQVDSTVGDYQDRLVHAIASIHGVPPSWIGSAMADAKYANAGQASRAFFRDCLQPKNNYIAEALSKFLGTEVRFDDADLVRGDYTSQIKNIDVLVRARIMPISEAREQLKLRELTEEEMEELLRDPMANSDATNSDNQSEDNIQEGGDSNEDE